MFAFPIDSVTASLARKVSHLIDIADFSLSFRRRIWPLGGFHATALMAAAGQPSPRFQLRAPRIRRTDSGAEHRAERFIDGYPIRGKSRTQYHNAARSRGVSAVIPMLPPF